tara:strand:- start:496 stop:873 length:378 start_codon:yes stop_codon:yes gene_type:complete
MRTIIFSTTDITRRGGRVKLLKAVELGFDRILVATTRNTLSHSDDWWVEIVGKENIFLNTGDGTCATTSEGGWRNLYKHLGEEWPNWTITLRDGSVHTAPMRWDEAQRKLQDLGYDIGMYYNWSN